MFPPEIWEIILRNVDDPFDLIELQLVCKNWLAIIRRIFSTYLSWKEIGENHVPVIWTLSAIDELNRNMDRNHINEFTRKSLDSDRWKRICLSWRQWQKAMRVPESVEIIDGLLHLSESERITCLVTERDIIAVGTSKGKIYFSYYLNWRKPFFIAEHDQAVADIQIWYMNEPDDEHERCDRRIAVAKYADDGLKYWEYAKRRELNSSRHYGQLMATSKLSGNTAGCYFISEGKLSRSKYTLNSINRSWRFTLPPLGRNENIVAMLAMDEIEILSFDGEKTRVYYLLNTSFKQPAILRYVKRESIPLPRDLVSSNNKEFCFLYNHFTVCLSDHLMAFSYKSQPWIMYNMFDRLDANVRCVATDFTGCALILGLDTGAVHVSYMRDVFESGYSDLENFDFANSASRQGPYKIQLSNEPLISVSTVLTNGHHIYVAATEKNIHVDQKKFCR